MVFPRPVFDGENNVIGAHNLLVDITEQKKNEAKQSLLSAVVESSDDAIISKNLNGIILSWNTGAERILGYPEKEVIGKHISILIPPELAMEEDNIIQNIKNGGEVHVSLTVSPVKDHYGHIIGASKIARAITQRVQREQLVKQSEESWVCRIPSVQTPLWCRSGAV